ncbi:hypothetical protein KPL39_02015 [Clostridium gasigenes]|uniref:hypothetical protein n=1 Tax=Clostridium gasigenes TaxID=94869 RepID=UPI001C0ADA75|nr:hypothetical protein [Clostridium gasigenes]MBU3135036.1 hypothetical protein [Clostridium gasigenes]
MASTLVFKQKIAYKMATLGHLILDKIPNKNNGKLYVYVFEATEKFYEDLEKVKEEDRQARA